MTRHQRREHLDKHHAYPRHGNHGDAQTLSRAALTAAISGAARALCDWLLQHMHL